MVETHSADHLPPVPPYRVEGSGPLLLYIAGLDGTGELFFKQTAELAARYRVASFRQRARGEFTYEDLADDVAAIIRDLHESSAIIVAESFGGGVGLTFALRYPDMVEKLVIVNSFPRYRERIRIKLAAKLASLLSLRIVLPVRLTASALGLWIDGVSPEDRRRFFEVISTVDEHGYARRLQLISELDLDDRLSDIEAPTLLIAAERDLLVRSAREARLMAERIPNARVKIIRGAGHACLLGDRVRLADILSDL
jgi:pimeloyl-ACP methyl ester carboxylesterase